MTTFYQSKRLDNVTRLLKDLFPTVHFETVARGLRLVTAENSADERACSMLRVESEYWNYVISTEIDYNDDDEFEDSSATVDDPSELEDFFLSQPLASNICFSEDFRYESDFADIIYKLFFDLRYGNPLEERERNDFPYLLPLVSAYHSHTIEDHFMVATKEEDQSLYLFDDKISFEQFQATAISEIEWVFTALKQHLSEHYADEWVFQWQEVSMSDNVSEYFLIINKYLDKKTAERLAEYVDDEENYEKLMALTTNRAFPVARLGLTFTDNVVIISAPNRVMVDGSTEIDPSSLVSSYLIARDGYLPKDYALLSIQNCIADLFSCVVQIIIRDADIDSIEDLSDLLF
jgi:hypothetical protein